MLIVVLLGKDVIWIIKSIRLRSRPLFIHKIIAWLGVIRDFFLTKSDICRDLKSPKEAICN